MLNILLVITTIGFLIFLFLYLKKRKKLIDANMLLKKWNVHHKEKTLVEKKQKRKLKI